MKRTMRYFLSVGMFLLAGSVVAETPASAPVGIMEDPIYVQLNDTWVGIYSRGGQYVEYSLDSRGLEPQDASHLLLKPHVGLMVTFADKADFGAGADMLDAHKNWEIEYQRKLAGKVGSRSRDDLTGGRRDLRATELSIPQRKGKPLTVYLIGLAMNDGVFVFSISPATPDIDPMV